MEMRLEEEEEKRERERERIVNCLYFCCQNQFWLLREKNLIFMFIIYNDIVTNFFVESYTYTQDLMLYNHDSI